MATLMSHVSKLMYHSYVFATAHIGSHAIHSFDTGTKTNMIPTSCHKLLLHWELIHNKMIPPSFTV
jgi:hypothetical protein